MASYTAASVSALIADINAANTSGGANTITLTAATNAPYVLTESGFGIRANDTLTIIGNGDTIERSTAAGTPFFRLFYVNAGGSLTLENLTLQGGSATQPVFSNEVPLNVAIGNDGGATFDQGTLTLSGVTVQDNTAASGGGICSYGGSVTLEGGSILQQNSAGGVAENVYTNGSDGVGGGLYANGGTVTVTNAGLDNNNCVGLTGWSDGVDYDTDGEGGGMYAYECTVTMTNATLNNNTVGPFLGGEGGGLYAKGGTVTMTNATVDNNSGGLSGGGLDLIPAAIRVLISATLSNCTVQGNSAGQGGGLYFGGGTLTLANDTVESNSASDYGGGLYFGYGTITLTNDTVEFNQASNCGGLWISGATVYLDSFTLANTINNKDYSGYIGRTANIVGRYTLT